MGYLPPLSETNKNRDVVLEFGGYDHRPQISENAFDDMANMSSSLYPILSPRGKRGTLTLLSTPNGIAAKSNLFWVDGTALYHNGALVTGLTLQNNAKQFVSMGAYLLIWPDKVYYNTEDQTYGNLGAEITIAGDVTCTLTKQDGTAYGTPTVSSTAPVDPADGDLWLDTSQTTHILKQYSATSGTWVAVATTYVKIAAENIGAQFAQYDGVTISGLNTTSLNGDFILYGADENYIIITGIIDQTAQQTGGVTVKRTVPDMDFLTESENRVWGCSSEKHEIYACKQGDPKNWHCFMNVSTDSYAATIGSDGDFTGAATFFGQVLFFKEDVLHKVVGSQPSNYQITNIPCRGVEKGSEKSLAIVNERLYYKARTAICMYDGAMPTEISAALGDVRYRNGVGGTIGNKYYISMQDAVGTWYMFAFDAVLGLWHKEDNTHALGFATHEGELFYIDAATKKIMSVGGRLSVHEGGVQYDEVNGELEDAVAWFVESGDIGMFSPDNKYVSRFLIRLEVDVEKVITVSLKYDSSDTWTDYNLTVKTPKRTVKLPVYTQRYDHLRMKISGTGACRIFSIAKTTEAGGD
ncbi:MAG: hypothetical protein ACOYU3_07330 [Bacillota bacterium]